MRSGTFALGFITLNASVFLPAAAEIDGHELIVEPHLLERDRNFDAVWRGKRMNFEHYRVPFSASCWRR
jgi:hypothetical protein